MMTFWKRGEFEYFKALGIRQKLNCAKRKKMGNKKEERTKDEIEVSTSFAK